MKKISVRFCTIHRVFQLQFGNGYFLLYSQQLIPLLINIYREETNLFMHAYVCTLNHFNIDYSKPTKLDYQLCFGNLFVRLNRDELLYLLAAFWKDFEDLMTSIIVMSGEDAQQEEQCVQQKFFQ